MAISEDTVALVAAQLTQAWAVQTGESRIVDAPAVLKAYELFRKSVRDGQQATGLSSLK